MIIERDKISEDMMSVENCPLCDNKATYKVVDYGRAKMFDCPQCNVFVVSAGVEKKLPELDQNLINRLSLNSSKCPVNRVFHIHNDELSNIIAHYVPELKRGWVKHIFTQPLDYLFQKNLYFLYHVPSPFWSQCPGAAIPASWIALRLPTLSADVPSFLAMAP